jgi:hypothetical protein
VPEDSAGQTLMSASAVCMTAADETAGEKASPMLNRLAAT